MDSKSGDVTGVAVPENEESTALTTFFNEAVSFSSVFEKDYSFFTRGQPDRRYTDIKEYLARPFLYTTGTSAFNPRGQVVTSIVWNQPAFNAIPGLARLAGAFGWRFTMVFRLQIAATPFQAGRLRMVWQPQQGMAHSPLDDRALTVTQATQLPGVELDVCEDTSAVLRVPWTFNRDFWVWSSYYDNSLVYGKLTVLTYMPVVSASGTPTPSFSLWVSFEDVEIVGACTYAITSS